MSLATADDKGHAHGYGNLMMRYAHRLMRGISIRGARLGVPLLGLLLLATACSTATEVATTAAPATSTTAAATTTAESTTTAAPTTTQATTVTVGAPTVTVGEGVDPAVVDRLTVELQELIGETEQLRGLQFLAPLDITILSGDGLADRVADDLAEEIVPEETAVEGRFYQLIGLLEPGDDLEQIFVDLYSESVAGFYDPDTGELVIGGDASDLTPYTKTVVIHEMIHALTDQQFLFNDDYEAMWDEERYDEAAAFQALIEGDATYFQFVYMSDLPLAEQLAISSEAMRELLEAPPLSSYPAWLVDSLAFPYENGRTFVEALVDDGGIAAVDTAYTDRPVSTEVIMDPSRYESGEQVAPVPAVEIEVDGYESLESSSFGEWGLRLLLSNAPPGVAVEASNGWGGDQYQILYDDDDIILALAFKGDSEADAFELAEALQGLMGTLEMGEPVASGGGAEYNAEDGRYAFLDRIGDGFIFVLSTDAIAGAAVVDQMHIP